MARNGSASIAVLSPGFRNANLTTREATMIMIMTKRNKLFSSVPAPKPDLNDDPAMISRTSRKSITKRNQNRNVIGLDSGHTFAQGLNAFFTLRNGARKSG